MQCIDLNADLGEGGPADAGLMPLVSSCNIACGGHAGDRTSMTATLALAKEHGVVAGAHPSYPDRQGFGRRPRFATGRALFRSLNDQVSQLAELAELQDVTLSHLKPHGALYHDANEYAELSTMLASLAKAFGLSLVGPPSGALRGASDDTGVAYVAEGFVDRAYDANGRLVKRGQPGAVFDKPEMAVRQALSLVRDGCVRAADGRVVPLTVNTLCLHGDTPDALRLAVAIRSALSEAGIEIGASAR